jgi:hypothetical protein
MSISKITVFALSLTLLAPEIANAAQKTIAPQDTPVALFREIYGAYSDAEPASAWHKADKNWSESGDIDKLPGLATLPLSSATAALNKRVDKESKKVGAVCIDYDMISNSQDPDIARYKIVAPTKPGDAQYEIYLQGKRSKQQTRISYLLAQEDGKWRVDDILNYFKTKGRVTRESAKALLQNCLKD